MGLNRYLYKRLIGYCYFFCIVHFQPILKPLNGKPAPNGCPRNPVFFGELRGCVNFRLLLFHISKIRHLFTYTQQ